MPWQQYVVDVALEIDPATKQLAYSEVGLTVPRQSGKSTLLLAKSTHRASATQFFGGRQRIVYTAQTRAKAREKWEEDFVADLKASKTFKNKITPHLANGNEHVRFPNGSRFGIEANTPKSGHGPTLDEGYIDEAFSQVDSRLEQAFRPAMITRKNKQLWVVSTAGWQDDSPYLAAKVAKGRAAVLSGAQGKRAYFEWSAPEDADPNDRSVWWECMPALGYTITEEAIAAELELAENLADFRRAYLNQWVPKEDGPSSVFTVETWAGQARKDSVAADPISLALDGTPDRSRSSIAIASRRDGGTHGEVIANQAGTAWLVGEVLRLRASNTVGAVIVDPSGPVGSLIPDLEEAGVEVTKVTGREFAQACGAFYDAVVGTPAEPGKPATPGTFTHPATDEYPGGAPILTTAVSAARKRKVSDLWAWSRTDGTDISPLVALTLAHHGLSCITDPESIYETRGMVTL